MKTLVLAKDKEQFDEFARWQARPEDFFYVAGPLSFEEHPGAPTVMMPMWYHNPLYEKIHDIKSLVAKNEKRAKR